MTEQPTDDRLYTIPEAMRLSGGTWRQVHHWIQKGWLESSRGEGWTHLLTGHEVRVTRVMVHLIGAGLTAARASREARRVLANPGESIRLNDAVTLVYTDAPVTYTDDGNGVAAEVGA